LAWIKQHDRMLDAPTDREVRSTVVHRLRENPYTDDCRIKVTVDDGVVGLDGRVHTPDAKVAAAEDAWAVPGVFEVDNHLVVDRAA
jgi:osmotically-inducible protein OsmY